MEDAETWRAFLTGIVGDQQERLRIARAIGVHPITLTRWAKGGSSPRSRHLWPLLNAIPEPRKHFFFLLAADYPELLLTDVQENTSSLRIPPEFYPRLLEIHTSYPIFLRGMVLAPLILQQMLAQLDPQRSTLTIFFAQCMPPSHGKVRSVRMLLAHGSGRWQKFENRLAFYGIESQIGHAVQEQRYIVTQSGDERERYYAPRVPEVQSVASFPIQLAGRVAGGVSLLSSQHAFFSPERLSLLEAYSQVLTLLFEQNQFYSMSQIEMAFMPLFPTQQPLLASFQQRVNQRLLDAARKQEFLTLPQAQMEIWQELEQILLHFYEAVS